MNISVQVFSHSLAHYTLPLEGKLHKKLARQHTKPMKERSTSPQSYWGLNSGHSWMELAAKKSVLPPPPISSGGPFFETSWVIKRNKIYISGPLRHQKQLFLLPMLLCRRRTNTKPSFAIHLNTDKMNHHHQERMHHQMLYHHSPTQVTPAPKWTKIGITHSKY